MKKTSKMKSSAKKIPKIVFLDRDGVINEFPGHGKYVTKVKEFEFIDGSLDAIRKLTQEGYHIFVVSNQAGVGKGLFSKRKLDLITRKMIESVKRKGGRIKRAYYCIHRSNAGCECRKPRIGNIVKAFDLLKHPVKLARHAYFVGDTEGDIQAGKRAGCKTIFVLSGMESRRYLRYWKVKPDHVVKNLLEAADIILNGNGRPAQ